MEVSKDSSYGKKCGGVMVVRCGTAKLHVTKFGVAF